MKVNIDLTPYVCLVPSKSVLAGLMSLGGLANKAGPKCSEAQAGKRLKYQSGSPVGAFNLPR